MTYAGDLAWVNDYVGVPFVENGRTRDGWDCWGLVLAVYRDRLGLELPDYRWSPPYGPLEKLAAFGVAVDRVKFLDLAAPIDGPEAWAIGLVRANNRPHHVGVSIGGGVLHAQRYGGTVYVPVNRFLFANVGCQWFRWRR